MNEFDPFLRRGVPRYMSSSYNQIAGQSVERVAGLSDVRYAAISGIWLPSETVRPSKGSTTRLKCIVIPPG